ncbi:hypothetical protein [Ruegeria sp. 6PALISEP08]|uniref:hypothetical protein n=1 Tax=Ruegeria sp. 6PALISEP08 TaxID=1225660 RepID=UPI0020A0A264|nr:hypothetical protein [Ruegeria sp. 6PALISEP08]
MEPASGRGSQRIWNLTLQPDRIEHCIRVSSWNRAEQGMCVRMLGCEEQFGAYAMSRASTSSEMNETVLGSAGTPCIGLP